MSGHLRLVEGNTDERPVISIGFTTQYQVNETTLNKDLIAVFCGSFDLHFENYMLFTYIHCFDEQEPSLESTNEIELIVLKEMACDLFKIYKEENTSLPKDIIFFRQTRDIRINMITFHKKEVLSLKQAYKEVDRDYIKPDFICIEISQTNITFKPFKVSKVRVSFF